MTHLYESDIDIGGGIVEYMLDVLLNDCRRGGDEDGAVWSCVVPPPRR